MRNTITCLLSLGLGLPGIAAMDSAAWKAGAARVDITPERSLWMIGFGARKKPSEGVLQRLHAKALALEDQTGARTVLVTADILGFPSNVTNAIVKEVEGRFRIPRERILLNASHTHGGPAIESPRKHLYGPRTSPEQNREIAEYTRELERRIVFVTGEALKNLRPATLLYGRTEALFGYNRRLKTEKGWVSPAVNKDGPRDTEVPILRVESGAGSPLAFVFGYACHTTAVSAATCQFHGDYAGYAQEWLERRHPGSTAMFVMGCGADITAYPRGTPEYARLHGETLAAAVDALGNEHFTPVRGPLRPAFANVRVPFGEPPTRRQLEDRLTHPHESFRWHAREMLQLLDRDGRLPADYPYPVQVWRFGRDLTLVALGGEVVVDYSLRIKRELAPANVWVAGYSNDVFAYIPSLRVLNEGGYEGADSMIYYVQPAPFAPAVEEIIITKVKELVRKVWAGK